ncbi:MAG: GNVR domain-containing protein [Burkholderia contaminans]|uniref:GNVR domain-containing protein n=1 Tax=Burkholderia contaminans TaxID=488447 RepID=A0AAP4R486_9BURK|nr:MULTISPECIES: GNVR domain-containing protein [Burkholderia]MBD1411158.1 lipopolysaccharide biosynthesis protein [Burkholderia contaminans]MBH9666499.1 lipopolysaccharide biosynthesis protein [Burkholderia contaminans]MBH9673951.1 lipopolysaccharide biosynthesis protein [Burkholderia contaminans]MBH9703997.1 lipopolysaccharide biosynthesis protein [Burkholderia contaminans]MBH9719545.1 lipopolysaccharide biosynthesis protein [Burkholderia contaminans]
MALDRPSPNEYRDGAGNISRDASRFTLAELLENVFYYRGAFISVFLGCLLLAFLYAISATPIYSVDTLIQVQENKHSALGSLSEISNALDIQNSAVVGEIDIARSRTVVTQAIEATAAQAEVSVSNRIPLVAGLLGSILSKDANGLVIPLFNTPFWAWGGERIEFTKFDVPNAQLGKKLEFDYLDGDRFVLKDSDGQEVLKGVIGTPSEGNGYRVNVSRIVARAGTEFRVRRVATPVRLDAILTKLTGAETKRQSGIMQLNLEDPDPVFAARLLNAIAAAYLDVNAKRRSEDAERSQAFLDAQLPAVKARLEQAEQALNTFRNAQGSIDSQGDVRLLIDQLALVDKARLDAKLEYQDLSSKYVAGQPQLAAVVNKLKTLDQQSAELKSKVAHLPSQQQTYLRLARDVEVNNQLYVGLLNNTQQLQIAKAGTVGNASIIDKADVSVKPIRPKRMLVIVLGAAVGLILGVAVAQGYALFFGRVRDPKHLESMVGVPLLGVLPSSPQQIEADSNGRPAFMAVREHPDTPFAEAIADLALLLHCKMTTGRDGAKTVLITSPEPGQGKSMITANLACLSADSGVKTLLVRAHAGEASIERCLPVKVEKCLSDVLKGSVDLKKVISRVHDNLDVLPAGAEGKPLRNLYGTEKLEALFTSLRGAYDLIIVDAPMAHPAANVAMLSRFTDITLMVVRQGSVSSGGVADAIGNLKKFGADVDGLVFNGFEPSPFRYGYYANARRPAKEAQTQSNPRRVPSETFLFRAWMRVRKELLRNVA